MTQLRGVDWEGASNIECPNRPPEGHTVNIDILFVAARCPSATV